MKKEKIIKFMEEMIDAYKTEAIINIEERSTEKEKDKQELEKECEEILKEFLELLEDK